MALRVDDVDLVRDRALVERFQEGDAAVFDTLYCRYFARLVRYCQKRVGDPLEAEEIAEEAFVRALRALPTFEGERRFYPWMTVIAGRLCVDAHRRRGRTEPSSQIDLGVIEGGQEKVVDAVDVQILATALGRLAPRHREVLDLREQQGRSYQEIADHYGVTLGTVEALLFRARKALKREFMAVVGGERNWAAVPVLGGTFGRLAAFKAKVDAWAAGVLPALSGPAVAAALAVTAVTGAVGGAVLHHQDAPKATSSALVRMQGLVPAAATTTSRPEILGGVSDAPVTSSTSSASGTLVERVDAPGARPVTTPSDAVAGAVGFAEVGGYAEAEEQSQADPIRVEPAPGVLATWNPAVTTADVVQNTSDYIEQLGENK